MIHLSLAEDKPRLAKALAADLALFQDLHLSASYANGRDVVDGLAELPHLPDLIFMDIEMPKLDGIAATAAIKAKHPQIKILMLTVFEDEENLFRAIQAGADGYLLKGASPKELYKATKEALAGGAPMTPMMARKTLKMLARTQVQSNGERDLPEGLGELSERETEVLQHLSAGLTYKAIAANLFLSEGTIRKHVENVYRKLRVNNKTSAVAVGRRLGKI